MTCYIRTLYTYPCLHPHLTKALEVLPASAKQQNGPRITRALGLLELLTRARGSMSYRGNEVSLEMAVIIRRKPVSESLRQREAKTEK